MWGVAVAAVIPVTLGVLVFTRSRQRWCGVLLVAHGVSMLLLLGLDSTPVSEPPDSMLAGSWVLLYLWLILLVYLAPDGRPAAAGWRRWIIAGCVCTAVFVMLSGTAAVLEPAAAGAAWYAVLQGFAVLSLAGVGAFCAGIVPNVWWRLRRAGEAERTGLLWLIFGALGVPAGLFLVWANQLLFAAGTWLDQLGVTLAVTWLPVWLSMAVLRHQLFDIRVVLSRTLAYTGLLVVVFAVYALVLAVAGALTGGGTLAAVLAMTVAVLVLTPLFGRVRTGVERWVYGYRASPDAALRELSRRLSGALGTQVQEQICAGVAQLLRVPEVWLEPARSTPMPGTHRTTLSFRQEPLADLVLRVPASRRLGAADLALLTDLGGYAALVLHVERLNGQLSASRSRIVTAREEERRRLRRDLHDGLGPALAGLVLKLNVAGRTADPALIAEARADTMAAVAEVRRVVEGLRPPALDEVGLAAAIEERGRGLVGAARLQLRCDSLPKVMPAAVEVAAYRIAVEALTNVGRHAAARTCVVELSASGPELQLSVTDDGVGWPAARPGGAGWESMTERAVEIGGSCRRSTGEQGGVRLTVRLPLAGVSPGEEGR